MTAPGRRFRLDSGVQRFGRVVVGGSPLRLFRLTEAGRSTLDRIADGRPVEPSRLIDRLLDAGAIHPVPDAATTFGVADVTVVVPTLGVAPTAPPGAVVVDDGSWPPVPGAAVRRDRTGGPAAARNTGLWLVDTPLVAFVDADVEVTPDWLDALLPHFDDQRVALVAPRVRSRERAGRLARYERTHSPLDLGAEPARVRPGSRVSYVPAAAVVARTGAVVELGGFDESLRFGEDVDLVWRLDAAGHRVRYEPASEVVHAPRPTWRGWWRQRVGYGSSAAPLARRHPGALAPVRMSGWSVASWCAAVAVHPAVGLALGGGSAVALVRKLPDVPARAAFGLAWIGNVRAGGQLAQAVRRVWWPAVALVAVRSRTARRVLVWSLVAGRHPIRVADDVAYSLGVWRGVATERTVAPLVPSIGSWPGRAANGPVSGAPARGRREPSAAAR